MTHRMLRGGLMAVLLLVAGSLAASEPSPEDRAALQALVERSDAVWNARDANGMAALYSANATLRIIGRDVAVNGASAIHDYFTRSFAGLEPGMRHSTRLTGLHPQSDDVVLADAHVRLIRVDADGAETLVREFTTLTVAVRDGKQWRLSAVRAVALPRAQTQTPGTSTVGN